MRYRNTLLTFISVGALLAGYLAGVFFSYKIIPFNPVSYNILLKSWPADGYSKLVPGKYFNPNFGVYYSVNSKGFRGPEFTQTKSSALRIIAIGESSTIGLEVPEDQTWPHLMEQHLARLGIDAEVINAGMSGSTSSTQRRLLEKELLNYEPDLIVYYAGFNDHNTIQAERYDGESNMTVMSFTKFYLIYKAIQLRWLLLRSVGYDIAQSVKVFVHWQYMYEANLRLMVGLARETGVRFLIVPQVLRYPQNIFEELATRRSTVSNQWPSLYSKIEMSGPNWHHYLRQLDVLRIQERVAEQHGVPVRDLHREFLETHKNGTPLFVGEMDSRFALDLVHLTAQANEVIARALAAWISEELLPA